MQQAQRSVPRRGGLLHLRAGQQGAAALVS